MKRKSEIIKTYMNIPEAGEYMRIGVRTIRELIAIGDLKAVRIGRRVILRKVDIDEFMAQHVY